MHFVISFDRQVTNVSNWDMFLRCYESTWLVPQSLLIHQLISLLVHNTQDNERENHGRNTNNYHRSSDSNERGQHYHSNSHDCVHAIGSIRRLRSRERGGCRPDRWNPCRSSGLHIRCLYVPPTQEEDARGGGADERRIYGAPTGQFRRNHVKDGDHVQRGLRDANGRGKQLHVPEQENEHEALGSSARPHGRSVPHRKPRKL